MDSLRDGMRQSVTDLLFIGQTITTEMLKDLSSAHLPVGSLNKYHGIFIYPVNVVNTFHIN